VKNQLGDKYIGQLLTSWFVAQLTAHPSLPQSGSDVLVPRLLCHLTKHLTNNKKEEENS